MLHVDDDAFVRAPAPLLYRRLTDIGRWPTWWPRLAVAPVADGTGREAWALDLKVSRRTHVRLVVRPHTYRHDEGFALALAGDLQGRAEFWLERLPGGTIVHHLVAAQPEGPPRRTLVAYRRHLRRGLWGLKDATQTEVRTAVGLAP